MNPTRIVLLAAVAMALGGCGGSSDNTTTEAATTTATTTAAVTTITTAATTTTAPPVTTVSIRVVGGKPDGGIVRQTVDKGARVVVVVDSDTADEVHIHGYDISADVEAGTTVEIPFVADTPGRFEIELENLGVELAEITVQ